MSSEPSKPRPSVLLIDDERPYLEMLRAGLSREFEIEAAQNTEEGEMRLAVGRYDAIVCDHLMPGEKGLDFLIRASQRHPNTRRILITGYINPELLSRSMSVAKLARCIIKPVGISELARTLREVLAEPVAK